MSNLTQYSEDEPVELLTRRNNKPVIVTGVIQKVKDLGLGLQHLTIYGTCTEGQAMDVKTYNDNVYLKKRISQPQNS